MMTRLSSLSWPPQSVTQITPQQKIQFRRDDLRFGYRSAFEPTEQLANVFPSLTL